MPPRKCCCSFDCLLASDDFNRADSSDLGTDWYEHSGAWSIVSGQLIGGTPGILATRICHPSTTPLGSFVAVFKLVNIADGNVYKIACGDPLSAPDYTVTWTFAGSPGTGTVAVDVVGDTAEQFVYDWAADAPDNGEVTVCYAPGMQLSASGPKLVVAETETGIVGDGGDNWVTSLIGITNADNCHTTGGETYGNFAFLEGDFDDWFYYVERLENEDCDTCDCVCKDSDGRHAIPKTLTATITNVAECAGLAGSYTLTQKFAGEFGQDDLGGFPHPVTRLSAEKAMWVSGPIQCPDQTLSDYRLTIILVCNTTTERRPNMTLSLVASGDRIDGSDGLVKIPPFYADFGDSDSFPQATQEGQGYGQAYAKDTGSCDPINLEFPTFFAKHNTNEDGDYCCESYGFANSGPDGEIDIVVTE